MKTLHLMMQMKKHVLKNIALDDDSMKKTAHLKMKMKKTVL